MFQNHNIILKNENIHINSLIFFESFYLYLMPRNYQAGLQIALTIEYSMQLSSGTRRREKKFSGSIRNALNDALKKVSFEEFAINGFFQHITKSEMNT